MAEVDTLEALDNKTLRAKCNEYGLPNIPITDTSRKLLIKRLRKAMESGVKPEIKNIEEKPKSRRETIHVIKVETEAIKETGTLTPTKTKVVNNRRTIGPTANAAPVYEKEEELSSKTTITPRRRSSRTTPISQHEPIVPPTLSKRRNDDMIQEDDDEEPISVPVIIEKSTASQENRRQSREPSLSKSVTVTTSYVRDTPPPKEIVEEIYDDTEPEEEEEDDEGDEYEEERDIVGLDPEPIASFEPTKYKYMAASRTYDMSKPFASHLDKTSSYAFSNVRTSQQPNPRVSLNQASALPSYESMISRRYTTGGGDGGGGGGYRESSDGENRTFVHHHTEKYKNDEKDTQMDTPYLSEFARRLSHIKAEPIVNTSISNPKVEEKLYRQGPTSTYYSPASRIASRRGIAQDESIGESFNKFLTALDRKYNIKRNFIILAIIVSIIFIYILFF